MEVSEAFINKITHLRRGGTIAGKAPHKPALLITVFQMIAKGLIQENRIYITPELVGLFKANCKLLAGISYEAEFTQPFCYLQNERIKDKPIWLLTTRENVDSFSLVKSFERFKEEVMFASFNETHFEFIKDKINAIYLVEILLETYFLDRKADFNGNDYESNDYWSLFESDLLEESEESYSKSVE
ncbi:MAG: putative restriction endonuclease, partial [Arenicella sp.]